MKIIFRKLFGIVLLALVAGCNKKDFLDAKPNSDIFVPTTLEDFQTLLDQDVLLNTTPVLGDLSADNFYIVPTSWQLLSLKEHNAYIWAKDIFEGDVNIADWNAPYQQVMYANVVLDGLQNVQATADNQAQWNTIKGYALFIRAYAFYNLAQVFALPYHSDIKDIPESGIPLKLSPNVDEKIKRSTLEETYNQIITDLLEAKNLLSPIVTNYRNRPNKPAAYAQLARVHLSMRQYDKAGVYADTCLQLYSSLINYNTKDQSASRPFDRINEETIYQSRFVETNVLKGGNRDCIVDTTLYGSYAANDLRKSIFFAVNIPNTPDKANLKGGYSGTIFTFSGLATDEMYLIRAECKARSEDISGAMKDLNTLLVQRFKTGTFITYTANTTNEALNIILDERRKEMPCRGVRWTDIRRLNLEGAAIKPVRNISGQVFELPVNSPRYALPIPPDAYILGGYKQNER